MQIEPESGHQSMYYRLMYIKYPNSGSTWSMDLKTSVSKSRWGLNIGLRPMVNLPDATHQVTKGRGKEGVSCHVLYLHSIPGLQAIFLINNILLL